MLKQLTKEDYSLRNKKFRLEVRDWDRRNSL